MVAAAYGAMTLASPKLATAEFSDSGHPSRMSASVSRLQGLKAKLIDRNSDGKY